MSKGTDDNIEAGFEANERDADDLLMADNSSAVNKNRLLEDTEMTKESYLPSDTDDILKEAALHHRNKSIDESSRTCSKLKEKK